MADFDTESCAPDDPSQTSPHAPGGLRVVLMLCVILAAIASFVAYAYFVDARAVGGSSGCPSTN